MKSALFVFGTPLGVFVVVFAIAYGVLYAMKPEIVQKPDAQNPPPQFDNAEEAKVVVDHTLVATYSALVAASVTLLYIIVADAFMKRHKANAPVHASLVLLLVAFAVITILAIARPKFVLIENSKKLNVNFLITLAVIIGLVVAIIDYVVVMKYRSSLEFEAPLSACYPEENGFGKKHYKMSFPSKCGM